jgi:predicted nuclease of predicted toxin-antitoxin system
VIRLLIDENLPAALAAKLFCPCLHATALGEQPTDKLIWDHGRRDGWTLLTKDTDFFERLALEGPPLTAAQSYLAPHGKPAPRRS